MFFPVKRHFGDKKLIFAGKKSVYIPYANMCKYLYSKYIVLFFFFFFFVVVFFFFCFLCVCVGGGGGEGGCCFFFCCCFLFVCFLGGFFQYDVK